MNRPRLTHPLALVAYSVAALLLAVACSQADPTPPLTFVDYVQDGDGGTPDGLRGVRSAVVSPDGRHVYTAAADDDAIAVFSRDEATGSLTYVEVLKDGVNGVDGLDGATSVTVSPDGRHVYAAADIGSAVALFSRDQSTGLLTFVEALKDGVGGVDGLDGALSVTVSPDGANVYVAAGIGSAIVVFSRTLSTGRLTFVAALKDGVDNVDGLNGAISLVASPDGRHLYAVGVLEDSVAVFVRDVTTGMLTPTEPTKSAADSASFVGFPLSVTLSSDGRHLYVASGFFHIGGVAVFSRDAATGALAFVEEIRDEEFGLVPLGGASSVTVSPDGANVYVAAPSGDAVVTFSRNTQTGSLTMIAAARDGRDGAVGLDGVSFVALSPDGRHAYAVAGEAAALTVLARDGSGMGLSFVETFEDGGSGVDGLNGVQSISVSPDGRHVYAVGQIDDAVAVFRRNAENGALTYVEALTDGVGGIDGLDGASSVAVGPDGRHVYVAAIFDSAVTAFSRDSTTGTLSLVETMLNDQVEGISGGANGLTGAGSVVIAPDGRNVYVGSAWSDGIATFRRDTTTGKLEFVQPAVGGLNPGDGLVGASLAIPSDGRHLYVASGWMGGGAVTVFGRDGVTGTLSEMQKIEGEENGGVRLDRPSSVTVSPDDRHVYVSAFGDDAVTVFSRDTTSGELTFVETLQDGVDGVDGLGGANWVAVSPDGSRLYVAAFADGVVSTLKRNATTGALTPEGTVDYVGSRAAGLDGPFSGTTSPDGRHGYIALHFSDAVAIFNASE